METNSDNIADDDNEVSVHEDDDDEEAESGGATSLSESTFSFSDYSQRFCVPRVVSACAYILEGYNGNDDHTNRCALKLLHRIAWDNRCPSLVYQASMFRTFQKVLEDESPRFKEIRKFAVFILRKFTENAQSNPRIFMELLFWKSVQDAYSIENCYADDGFHKQAKGVWSEEQEDELRKLYMENQQNPSTNEDVIDWILENLVDQTRTRRGVIKKLKELGLIFKAPTKKSNVTLTDHFTSNEDEMLRDLWDDYGMTSDPMGSIMARMPIKRNRNKIVERLLQLGIIQDRRQCNKKTKSKSNHKHNNEYSGTSDEESNNDVDVTIKPSGKNQVGTNKKGQKYVYSDSKAKQLLFQCMNKGMLEPLKWLSESLEEVALDQEAEGFNPTNESVPLVAIMNECFEALNDPLFHELLNALGLQPPNTDQEKCWRIPSSIHLKELRKRIEFINGVVDGTLIQNLDKPNEKEISKEGCTNNDSSDEDIDKLFDKLKANRIIEYYDKTNEQIKTNDSNINSNVSISKRQNKTSATSVDSDSHDNDGSNINVNLINEKDPEEYDDNNKTITKNKRQRRFIYSDSESDTEGKENVDEIERIDSMIHDNKEKSSDATKKKSFFDSDEDTSFNQNETIIEKKLNNQGINEFSKMGDSDSEEDSNKATMVRKRKRYSKAIVSDDDDADVSDEEIVKKTRMSEDFE